MKYQSNFRILDKNQMELAVCTDAWDTYVDLAINETNAFKFTIAQTSPNAPYIVDGNFVEVKGQLYEIESTSLVRDRVRNITVSCQHVFWGLEQEYWENDFEVVDTIEWVPEMKMIQSEFYTYGEKTWLCLENHIAGQVFDATMFRDVSHLENNYMPATTPDQVLSRVLAGTGYYVAPSSTYFTPTDFTLKMGDVLTNVKEVQKVWGGEWNWNNYSVQLVEKVGNNSGVLFEYGVNNISVSRDVDSRDVVTRLYVYGKDGLTLEDQLGVQFIDADNISKYSKPKKGFVTFSDVDDIGILMTKASEHLQTVKHPHTTYSLTVAELKFLEGFSHYSFGLGDVVSVVDTQLFGDIIMTRVVNYSYNPFFPKESSVVLNNKDKTLVTIFNALKEKQEEDKKELLELIKEIPKNKKVVDKIVDTAYQQVVTIETAHILNAWIKSLYVDRVETNIDGILKGSPMFKEDRNFIVIEDQHIKFTSQDLSPTEYEDLLIPNPDSITGGQVYVYWTAIGQQKDAFKYFTITPPSVMMPNTIKPNSPEELAFRVKVHKVLDEDISMRLYFEDGGNNAPVMEFGQSVSNDPLDQRGKAYIKKDEGGLDVTYYGKVNGKKNNLRVDETGVKVDNTQTPIGQPVVRNIIVSPMPPNTSTGRNGDIWIVI